MSRLSLSRMGLRHHFRSDGTAKTSYETREAAEKRVRARGMVAYRCKVCHDWHLAKPKGAR